jgi:hypothetical protein
MSFAEILSKHFGCSRAFLKIPAPYGRLTQWVDEIDALIDRPD